ncbi:MFS-type transporter-like protein 66 [Elsinoe fawcettii]|nr:MFS-type transporter-like protein 66 [Elsinoe fawcettii]
MTSSRISYTATPDFCDISLSSGLSRSQMEQSSQPRIVDWDGPNDPDNPFNWTKSRKLVINILCLIATLSCNANATTLTVAWRETNLIYGISDDTFPNSYWGVTSWTLGGSISMAFLLPLTEDYSMRWGYLISYAGLIIFTIPQAVIHNFAGFLVLRFFAGGCVSMVANGVVGMSCDMWNGERSRNLPVSTYITTYLAGAALGPVVGAAILTRLDWTWIIWIQVIFHAALFTLIAIVLKETRGPVILRRRAELIRKQTGQPAIAISDIDSPSALEVLKISLQRPVWMFFTEYVVFTFTMWSSFAVGLVYLFTQSTELVFSELFGWSSVQAGFVQASIAIGMVLAWFANFYGKHLYFASASRNTETVGEPIPEAHLYVSIFGTFIGVLGGMFIYAWTAFEYVPWIGPAIGLAMVGFGINTIVTAVGHYLTSCYARFAVSACGAVGAGENLLASFLPLATMAMYHSLGLHWPSTILGIIAIPLGLAPVIMVIRGQSIRAKSPFIMEARYEAKDMGMHAINESESQELRAVAS